MRLADLLESPSWMSRAACRDADWRIWFPTKGTSTQRKAKAVCAGCPVVEPCLEYALTLPVNSDFGIYGGLSANERAQLRKERAAA